MKEDRERLWSDYQHICDSAREDAERDAKSNAKLIENEIYDLSVSHLDKNVPVTIVFPIRKFHYRDFWAHAREVSNMLKTLYSFKEERNELWENYKKVCDEVRTLQEQERNESEISRREIESLIDDAQGNIVHGNNEDDFSQARSQLDESQALMKEKTLIRDDREHCWRFWREVNDKWHWKRKDIQDTNYYVLGEEADRCFNNAEYEPYATLHEIKEIQNRIQELSLSKEQRINLRATLNDAWNAAISKIDELKEEKRQRHKEWREKMENNIEYWREKIADTEEYISRLEEQIDRLEDEASNARTDEYADRVQSWIDEKLEKIDELKEKIRGLENKITDVGSKLDYLITVLSRK